MKDSHTERYVFFSQDSKGADKNEFIAQYSCLQIHFSVRYKRLK